ncbi:cellulase family glycosylhydrolase [Streptomyces calidiresistens]
MKRATKISTALGGAAAVLLGMVVAAPLSASAQSSPRAGLHVADGRILEANGNDFVMRGVNHPHSWYTQHTAAFGHIKDLGANTVRVVLSSGDRWYKNDTEDVADVVSLCKRNRLICVLEVHDTTGYGEEPEAASLDQAVDYWIDIQDAIKGEEDYVVLNIGNEPHGNQGYGNWTADTISAINRLRDEDFHHLIMVDGPNWGQDWTNTMRTNARRVFDSDPHANTVFSIHMYGVYGTRSAVSSYLNDFVNAGLPILVGEFGHYHSDGNPDEDAILEISEHLGTGYLGWSWSGNSGGVDYLDMVVDFDPNRLTEWGERIFNGPNGIAATAVEATVYGDGGNGPGGPGDDTEAPTAPGTPTASDVTSTSVTLGWAAATDNVGVTGYDVVRVSGGQRTVVASSTSTSVTVTGLTPGTSYTFAVRARDAAGNVSPLSGTVAVTTSGGQGGADCAVDYRVAGSWPGGFQGEVVVTNTGSSPVTNWSLGWTFPGNQTVTGLWGGGVSQSGNTVTVTAPSWATTLAPNASASLGFLADWSGSNPAPTSFTLNGSPCTVD